VDVVIPPLVFYAVGIVLILGGLARAVMLGRRNPSREVADDDPAKARARRRHLAFGLVWVAMGIFLVVSTAGVLRQRAATANLSPVRGAGSSAPTIRLDPARPTTLSPPAKP
jgi:hypothetical protein